MLDIVYSKIELVIVMFNLSAVLGTSVGENAQQRKPMFRKERKDFVIEQISCCYRRFGGIQFCESDLGIRINKSLLIYSADPL